MIFDSNHSKLHVFMGFSWGSWGFAVFSWGFHGVFSHFVHRPSHIGSPLHQSAHAVHVVVGRRHVQRRAALGVRGVHLDAVGVEEFHQVLRQFEGGKSEFFEEKLGTFYIIWYIYMSIYVMIVYCHDLVCLVSLIFLWNRLWGRWPYIVYLYIIYIYTHDACTL